MNKQNMMGSDGDADFQEMIAKIQRDIEGSKTDLQNMMNSLVKKQRKSNIEYQDVRQDIT